MSLSFLLRKAPESPKKMKVGVGGCRDLRGQCRLCVVLSGGTEPSGSSAKLCLVVCKLYRWRQSMLLVLRCFILVARAKPTALMHLHISRWGGVSRFCRKGCSSPQILTRAPLAGALKLQMCFITCRHCEFLFPLSSEVVCYCFLISCTPVYRYLKELISLALSWQLICLMWAQEEAKTLPGWHM